MRVGGDGCLNKRSLCVYAVNLPPLFMAGVCLLTLTMDIPFI